MIVTRRGRWLIIVALAAAVIGLARQQGLIVRLSVASLIWMGLEWIAFQYRVDVFLRGCWADRQIRYRSRAVRTLWELRLAHVETQLRFAVARRWMPPVLATVHDLAPGGVEVLGDHGQQFHLGAESSLVLKYRIRPQAPGSVRFPGLRFVLRDLHGFFQAERPLPYVQRFRVLPLAVDMGTIATIRKHTNVLPPPGSHRQPRAGAGSDLLEIREYVPGDAPRSIAWKVSARRDELMCKQFEAEVPVRCQLFVDMSRAVRLGHPGSSLGGRLVSVAATIATTLASHRDPVGLSIFDGAGVQVSAPSANRKAIMQMIDRVCGQLDQGVLISGAPTEPLIRSAADIARMRYPLAMEYARNAFSSLLPRPSFRLRAAVAAAVCNQYRLDEWAMGELVDDDDTMSHWLQRFHSDHGASYPGSLYDESGRYLLDDANKLNQLSSALRHAAARSRDDELFVIMALLTDQEYDLSGLVQSIKFARARRHRVVVLLAWPPWLPVPKAPLEFDALLSESVVSSAQEVQRRQAEKQFAELSGELAKLKVPVAAAADGQAMPLILNQLEIISTGRISV